MASKRAKKHRQAVKLQQLQKVEQRGAASKAARQGFLINNEFKKQLSRANARLARLEKAGLTNEIYTQTTNTLGANRFRVPKSAEEYRQTKLILNKFLGAKTSTVKAARAASVKNKNDFAEFLKRAGQGKLSESAIDIVSSRMGDLDLSDLIKSYIYKEIVDAVIELEDSGIDATSENVNRALSEDIDSVILDTLSSRGVNVPSEIESEVIVVVRENGLEAGVDYVYQWLAESGFYDDLF